MPSRGTQRHAFEQWIRSIRNRAAFHYDPKLVAEEAVELAVQVNGKVRAKITVPADATQEHIQALALVDSKVIGFLEGKKVQRVVYVPRRLMNIVLEG